MIEAGALRVVRHGDDTVDGQDVGLAVDGAGRVGLVGVELDDAVEGVGVAHHGQCDGAAGIDCGLIGVGQIEGVAPAAGIVDDDELACVLYGCDEEGEALRDGEAGGVGDEGAGRASGGLCAVVDLGEAAVGVGEDVAENLFREVIDPVGVATGVPADGEAFDGVLYVAADVAIAVEDLEAALCAVGSDADHHAVGEFAGRDRPVGEGVLREVVERRSAAGEADGEDGEEETADVTGMERLNE